jgi:hypothetical protein
MLREKMNDPYFAVAEPAEKMIQPELPGYMPEKPAQTTAQRNNQHKKHAGIALITAAAAHE